MMNTRCMHPSYLFRLVWLSIFAIAIPISAFGQVTTCPTTVDVDAVGEEPFYLGDLIPIQLTLGAGNIEGPDANLLYLELSSFRYQMDCNPGESFPDCTSAGNTVAFAGPVNTTCVDAAAAASTFSVSDDGLTVTFTPEPDPTGRVRIAANSSCTVDFNVVVSGVSGDNVEKEIIELAGWSDTEGVCGNGEAGGNAASVSFDLSTLVSQVRVTKQFSDDNPLEESTVYLKCNGGNDLVQDFPLGNDDVVTFNIRGFQVGETDCEVYEEPTVPGYEPDYTADDAEGVAGSVTDDDDGCYFDDIDSGSFTCDIVNVLEPVPYVIEKVWDFGQDEGVVEKLAGLDVTCQNFRTGPYGNILAEDTDNYLLDGSNDELKLFVYPNWDDQAVTRCFALEEQLVSSVSSDQGCSDWVEFSVGGSGAACTIVNTVFFEGIPTLNRTGLAVMLLLMLGMGGFAVRRII